MRMKPIFLALVLISSIMCVYTWSIGLQLNLGRTDLKEREAGGEVISEEERHQVGSAIVPHFIWAMVTGITVCLVHTIVLVYFLGTGKAIQEQIDLGRCEEAYNPKRRKFMGQAVIPTVLGVFLIIGAAFSGGFAMIQKISPTAHLIIATLGVLGQLPIYFRQLMIIHENGKLMNQLVEQLGEDVRVTL